MEIGNKLKSFRIEKGLSTIQLAERINISETTYRRYENDRSFPNLRILDKLATLYGIDIMELFPPELQHMPIDNNDRVTLAYCATVNHLSDKLIEQYEARLKEKDELIKILKATIPK